MAEGLPWMIELQNILTYLCAAYTSTAVAWPCDACSTSSAPDNMIQTLLDLYYFIFLHAVVSFLIYIGALDFFPYMMYATAKNKIIETKFKRHT